MTKDRTGAVSTANALKMAIEALEDAQMMIGDGASSIPDYFLNQINACKKALDTKQVCENAAPAQEPLSDDEIYKMADEAYINVELIQGKGIVFDRLKFARAIEQAHGIGERNE